MLRKLMIVFTAAMAIGIATFPTNASAQWRGGGWHGGGWYGGGWGWGLGAGLLGGAIIGSALAAPQLLLLSQSLLCGRILRASTGGRDRLLYAAVQVL